MSLSKPCVNPLVNQQAKQKKCVNRYCPNDSDEFIKAFEFVCVYYHVNYNSKMEVCLSCYRKCLKCFKSLYKKRNKGEYVFEGVNYQVHDSGLFNDLSSDDDESDQDLSKSKNMLPRFMKLVSDFFIKSKESLVDVDCDNMSNRLVEKETRSYIDESNTIDNSLKSKEDNLNLTKAKFTLPVTSTNVIDINLDNIQNTQMLTAGNGNNNDVITDGNDNKEVKTTAKEDIEICKSMISTAQINIPKEGPVQYPSLKVGQIVYTKELSKESWVKSKIYNIIDIDNVLLKVYFEKKVVAIKDIAYSHQCPVQFPVGCRVIAKFTTIENSCRIKYFRTGVIGEPPRLFNNYRYLIFFDNCIAQYKYHKDIRLVIYYSTIVWKDPDVCFSFRQFIRYYLTKYPVRHTASFKNNSFVLVEYKNQWNKALILEIDASIVKVYFKNFNQCEWLYRGSPRLWPIFDKVWKKLNDCDKDITVDNSNEEEKITELVKNSNERNKRSISVQCLNESSKRSKLVKNSNEVKTIVISIQDSNKREKESNPVQNSNEEKKIVIPIEDSNKREKKANPVQNSNEEKKIVIPIQDSNKGEKKSNPVQNSIEEKINTVLVQNSNLRDKRSKSVQSLNESNKRSKLVKNSNEEKKIVIPVEDSNKREKKSKTIQNSNEEKINTVLVQNSNLRKRRSIPIKKEITSQPVIRNVTHRRTVKQKNGNETKIGKQTQTGRFINVLPKYIPEPRHFSIHTCTHSCIEWTRHSYSRIKSISMLAIPLYFGFKRIIDNSPNKSRQLNIIYIAPCGIIIQNIDDMFDYLILTKSNMTIDQFNFSTAIEPLASFRNLKYKVKLNDLSKGKESIPILCINEINDKLPPPINYITSRQPMPDVNINTDSSFLCGCDCTDNCQDKFKCACWKMTIDGQQNLPFVDNFSTGYNYKRLFEPVLTGIYECNKTCRCNSNCLNRVVQQPLSQMLQLFLTENKGWGVRCQSDIPKGSFICIFVGTVNTSTNANKEGKLNGDEYLADLDLIEVIENTNESRVNTKQCETISSLKNIQDPDTSLTSSKLNSKEKEQYKCNEQYPENKFEPSSSIRQLLYGENESVYTINASTSGNIGRYLNHSCSPNTFIQNVFVDTYDIRFPWISLFANQNIVAGTELTWDYNYEIDSVPGKILKCNCQSKKCRGRLL